MTDSSKQEDNRKKEWLDFEYISVFLLVSYLFFIAPVQIIWWYIPDSIKYPALYAAEYSVKRNRVHVLSKEPSDCEWSHAPLGSKDCHYEKRVFKQTGPYGRISDVYVIWEKVQE